MVVSTGEGIGRVTTSGATATTSNAVRINSRTICEDTEVRIGSYSSSNIGRYEYLMEVGPI